MDKKTSWIKHVSNNLLQGYYINHYVNDVSREMRVYISLFPFLTTIPNVFPSSKARDYSSWYCYKS